MRVEGETVLLGFFDLDQRYWLRHVPNIVSPTVAFSSRFCLAELPFSALVTGVAFRLRIFQACDRHMGIRIWIHFTFDQIKLVVEQ